MIYWPNMLLVAGTGRNVGKTTFVCRVIENAAKKHSVIAIKITPHVHDLCDSCIPLFQSESLIITEETSSKLLKDSSRMLAAGAKKVYFVQGADTQLEKVIEFLKPLIAEDAAIVCESAALRNYIKPGLFVLMSVTSKESIKKNIDKIALANYHILDYNYNLENIEFFECSWENKKSSPIA